MKTWYKHTNIDYTASLWWNQWTSQTSWDQSKKRRFTMFLLNFLLNLSSSFLTESSRTKVLAVVHHITQLARVEGRNRGETELKGFFNIWFVCCFSSCFHLSDSLSLWLTHTQKPTPISYPHGYHDNWMPNQHIFLPPHQIVTLCHSPYVSHRRTRHHRDPAGYKQLQR